LKSEAEKLNKPLNVAIIGFGGMGGHHAKAIEQVEDVNLSGTFDVLSERQAYSKSLGYKAYPSFESVLDDVNVDIALIATPNHLHKSLSIKALEAGKHVICEKPATINAAELEDILKAAEAAGRIFVVHQNRRWDEDFRVVKKVFEEETIGSFYNVESRVMGSQGIPGDWRTKLEFGGGMLLDWGVHLVDQLLWLFPWKIKRIYCKLGYVLGGECDDRVHLKLTFENGMDALVEVCTWNMETLPRWYVNGMTGSMTISDFWFKHGSITRLVEDVENNTKAVDAGKGITKTVAPRDSKTLELLELPRIKMDVADFYRNAAAAIRGEDKLIVKPEESLRVMRLMDAARRSAELDQILDFE
jgi:predicted dehydrogenase